MNKKEVKKDSKEKEISVKKKTKKTETTPSKKTVKAKNNNKFIEDKVNSIKKFLSNKTNVIITAIILVLILVVILFLIFHRKPKRFVLNEAYDVYPEEVIELYTNFVSISCAGDIHFDIPIDKGRVDVTELDDTAILNYTFSYLDKNNLLGDNIDNSVIRDVENRLFEKRVNVLSKINDFSYNGYIYNETLTKVKREKSECPEQETTYVTHLYGYYWSGANLYIDITTGYLKDGILYSFDDTKLGEYDGDVKKLTKLMQTASYYRVNYIRYDQNKYKFSNIEWKHKS